MEPLIVTTSDETLIGRYARSRDAEALDELVRRHWKTAYGISLRLLGDGAAAEDAAQEAFVSMIRGSRGFQAGRAFAPWFRTLVLNAARMMARSASARRRREERVARARPAEVAPEGEARASASEIGEHFDRLPFDVKAPLALHFYEGCSIGEVAQVLACSKSTAQGRISRGLERLRESLVGAGCFVPVAALESHLVSERARPLASVPPAPARDRLETLARRAARRALAVKLACASLLLLGLAIAGARIFQGLSPFGGALSRGTTPEKEIGQERSDRLAPPPASPVGTDAAKSPPSTAGVSSAGATPELAGRRDVAPVASASRRSRHGATIRGRVVDAAGSPVAGATVLLSGPHFPDEDRLEKFDIPFDPVDGIVQATAGDGSYVFEGVDRGPYLVRACTIGRGAAELALDVHGDEDDTLADLVLGNGIRVVGRAVSDDGGPAEGALIAILERNQTRLGYCLLAFATSRADGRFAIDGLHAMRPGERILLLASVDGRSPDASALLATRAYPWGPRNMHLDLSAKSPPVIDVGDVYAPSLRATLSGHVFGPGGQPVAGARVTASGLMTVSGSGGEYTLRGLPRGSYFLSAVKPEAGLAGLEPAGIVVRQDETVVHDLTLAPAGAVRGRLPAGSQLDQPVTVQALSFDAFPGSSELSGEIPPVTLTPDPDGSFRAAGLLPGRYRVGFFGLRRPAGSRRHYLPYLEVTVASGADTEVDPGACFGSGKISVRLSGATSADAAKEPFCFRLFSGAFTDPSCQALTRQRETEPATVFDTLGPGTYSVGLELSWDQPGGIDLTVFQENLSLPANGSLDLELPWPDREKAGSLEGRAPTGRVWVCGRALPGASVAAFVPVAKDGTFSIAALPPGEYQVCPVNREALGRGVAAVVETGRTTSVVVPAGSQ